MGLSLFPLSAQEAESQSAPILQNLAAQLRAQYNTGQGGSGSWDDAGHDRAMELAQLLYLNGVTDLGEMSFEDSTRKVAGEVGFDGEAAQRLVGSGDSQGTEWYDPATGAALRRDDTGAWRMDGQVDEQVRQLRIGDKTVGYLGDYNNDGTFGSKRGEYLQNSDPTNPENLLGWSARGDGNTSYRVVQDPATGKLVIAPGWNSSSDADAARGAALVVGGTLGAGYGLSAMGVGAGTAGTTAATTGGTAATGGSGLATFSTGAAPAYTAGTALPMMGTATAPALAATPTLGAAGAAAGGLGTLAAGSAPAYTAGSALPMTGAATAPTLASAGSALPTLAGAGAGALTTMEMAQLGLGAAGLIGASQNSPDIPAGTAPDPKLIEQQLRSMGVQDDVIRRMMANSDEMLPLQQEYLRFGLDSARTAYDQSQADRSWALGRRNALSGMQDRMVMDAQNYNTDGYQNQLAGQAMTDVQQAYARANAQSNRNMARLGVNPNSGAWAAADRGQAMSLAAAQANAANKVRTAARDEGFRLTDRATNALAGYPAMSTQATAAGAGYGASGLGMTNQGLEGMNFGFNQAGGMAGQMGNNAANMWSGMATNQLGLSRLAVDNDPWRTMTGAMAGAGMSWALNRWGK
jgi:hypothetical protein